jgi:N-acetylmuramoyl-L-alanine amidase
VKSVVEARMGVRVLITREDDRSIPLNERIALANNNKADIFISLHANASVVPTASGATIYVAGFDRDQGQTTLKPERVPVFGGGSRDIELVLWDFAQIRHIGQSAELLAHPRGDAARARHHRRPAVEKAPFRVLESANMPAVLDRDGIPDQPGPGKAPRGRRVPDRVRASRARRDHPIPRPPLRDRG